MDFAVNNKIREVGISVKWESVCMLETFVSSVWQPDLLKHNKFFQNKIFFYFFCFLGAAAPASQTTSIFCCCVQLLPGNYSQQHERDPGPGTWLQGLQRGPRTQVPGLHQTCVRTQRRSTSVGGSWCFLWSPCRERPRSRRTASWIS